MTPAGYLRNHGLIAISLVTIVALNDYKVAVPKEDFDDYQPIIAIKQNGEFMSVRDKGPYWLDLPVVVTA
ncbi:hypothetical protein OH492_17340 [Vibrio chagasii]|nr:hypothetical protein [Vibrio chagasii]